jgi:hypothetical protein
LSRRIDQASSPSERLLTKQKIAKAEMVCASASEGIGAETNERAISIATKLKNDPEIQKIGRYSNFLNSFGIHLGIQRRRNQTADYSEEEKVLTEALMADWKNHRAYISLSDLYEQKGEHETSRRYRSFRHLVQAWDQMKQVLNSEMGIHSEDGESGKKTSDESSSRSPIGRFDKTLKGFLGEAIGHGANCEKLFRPLNRTLRIYSKKIKKWIRDIAPENCTIATRPKSPYLILLKMLEKGKGNVTEISNLLIFKIETETAEDAKRLTEQIERRMVVVKRRDRPNEQGSADSQSVDLTGHLNSDSFTFLLQIRPKETESVTEKSVVNNENCRLNTIAKVDEEIAKDPQKHLQSLYDILVRLGKSHQYFFRANRFFSLADTLKIYEDPDHFEPSKK